MTSTLGQQNSKELVSLHSQNQLTFVDFISWSTKVKENCDGKLLIFQIGGAEVQEIVLVEKENSKVMRRIILTSENGGGSYEFVFTLIKEEKGENHFLNFLTVREPGIQEKKKEKKPKNLNEKQAVMSGNRRFREPTLDNEVEVLIDGLETFNKYYEVLMTAEHSIKILAWELSLSFGLVKLKSATTRPFVSDPDATWITLEVLLCTLHTLHLYMYIISTHYISTLFTYCISIHCFSTHYSFHSHLTS